MVKDTREKILAETFRPVNQPEPIVIEEDLSGFPKAIKSEWGREGVTAIDCWRIDDEWWRVDPLSRFYYAMVTETGRRLVAFKDLATGCWFCQEY